MIDRVYLGRLVKSVINNIGINKKNIMFIKHYNSLSVTKDEIDELCKEEVNLKLLFCELKSDEMQDAYEPFCGWIRQIYYEEFQQLMSVEEFIKNCNVYPPLIDSFVSYIKNEICIRREDIIISEIEEERVHVYESIGNILEFITQRKNLFMVINKVHFANYSTLDWMYNFLKDTVNFSFALLMIFNEAYPIPSYTHPVYSKLMNLIEKNNSYFDWDTISTVKIDEKQEIFLPNNKEVKIYINRINNMYHLHATKQALFYLERISQSIERDNIVLECEDKYTIISLHAMICISDGEYNTALLILSSYIYNDEIELKYKFWFNYIYGLAQTALLQEQMAMQSAKMCMDIAKKINSDYYIFKAEYLMCISKNYNWSQMFLVDFSNIKVDEAFINKLLEYGFENALAYIYVYSYENEPEFIDSYARGTVKNIEHFDKGIEIGERLHNTTFLRSAYMKNILIYADAGYHNIASIFYDKRLEVLKREKGRIREANTYNGIGFLNMVIEKYSQADQYFDKAMDIYFDKKNIMRIAETLYNSAINSLLAGDFVNSYMCVDTTFYILEKMCMQSVQMCNASKLYGIAGLSCYYLDQSYKTIGYVRKMELMMNHILSENDPNYTNWEEDMCFYYMLKGILAREENVSNSLRYFKLAEKFQSMVKGNMFITYSFLAIETAKTYRVMRQEDKAKETIEYAIDYSMKNGFNSKARLLIAQMGGNKKFQNNYVCGLNRLTFDDIRKLARSEGNKMRLEGRTKDINILSKWQETLKLHSSDTEKMVNNSMSSIFSTFNLDGGIFIQLNEGKYVFRYYDRSCNYSQDVVDSVTDFFCTNQRTFVVNRTDKNFGEYMELVNIFGVNSVATIIGIPLVDNIKVKNIFLAYVGVHRNFTANKNIMTEDNLTMIRSAFEQLVLIHSKQLRAEKLARMNEKLKEISYIDSLTGLYNRQGMKNILDKNIEEDIYSNNMLFYIDIDNFKTYNDLYGHMIGDHVLVKFSEELKKEVGKNGYSIRYGGDEFIAIIHNCTMDNAKESIRRIKEHVNGSVTDIVNKFYFGNLIVPESQSIDFSVGVAEFKKYSYSILLETLRNADKALYMVKNKGKGNVEFWNKEKALEL